MADIRGYAERLLEEQKVAGQRDLANELRQRLDTPSFRAALTMRIGENSNGWSTVFKALVVKVKDNSSKASHAELVGALAKLIDEAGKCDAAFEVRSVHLVLNNILNEELVATSTPAAKLYWSILGMLSSTDEYFRGVGREAAQSLCARLAATAWETILPAKGGAEHARSFPVSAARFLCRLLTHFPFALPGDTFSALLSHMSVVGRWCTLPLYGRPSCGAASHVAHELRPLMSQLLRATNAALRFGVAPYAVPN